jgi:hypothetical protein
LSDHTRNYVSTYRIFAPARESSFPNYILLLETFLKIHSLYLHLGQH